jgi:hypothetical protein
MSSDTALLEENNIHTCLLPPNTMDQLQPMDLSVNKNIEALELQPIPLPLSVLRELESKWLVEIFDYFGHNPQMISPFWHYRISGWREW